MHHCKNCTSVYFPRVEEAVSGGLGSSLGGCVIVGVMVQCVFFFYIILYHCKVDHFPWYRSPFLFYSSIGWQGGARVSCSSLGVGASIQLTTKESQALECPSSVSWRRLIFLDYRKLELYFQLELNIKELLEKHQVVFVSKWFSTLKTVCICVPFVYYYHFTNTDNN